MSSLSALVPKGPHGVCFMQQGIKYTLRSNI